VLITVFNGEKTIKSAIQSIQAQTIHQIRIIVVDDGSTDTTLTILSGMASCDHRIEVITKEHSGIVASLNIGLQKCTAEYIARFDADDISYPHRFSTQLRYLEENLDCMAVASSAIHIDENDKPLGTVITPKPLDQADPTWIPGREPYLLQPFLMIRRSSLNAVNGYRLCEVAEDSDLFWRLNEIGKIVNTTDILGAYRLNPSSISSKSIINGRRMAYCSQLVSISAMRRKNREHDLVFDERRIEECKKAVTLEDFCKYGGVGLTDNELLRLRIASSVKLLELVTYRPYELDQSDCRFIRSSIIDGRALMTKENRKLVRTDLVIAGIRLIVSWKMIEAFLLTREMFPYMIFRVGLRVMLPEFIRRALKKIKNRQVNA
jgi:glycosyltransferase involved in cell wall biosynthesis